LKTTRRICTKFFFQGLGENICSLQPALKSNAPRLWADDMLGVLIGVSALQLEDLSSIPLLTHTKVSIYLYRYSHLPCLTFSIKGIHSFYKN